MPQHVKVGSLPELNCHFSVGSPLEEREEREEIFPGRKLPLGYCLFSLAIKMESNACLKEKMRNLQLLTS